MNDDLIYRLRKRAEIRRQIPGRKSVENGEPDRIADLLEEAANEIERLEDIRNYYAEEQAKFLKPVTRGYILTCGCESQYGGFPSEWDSETRDCKPAVACGSLCEKHYSEYEARPAQYDTKESE